jgi:hypothetical protein
MEAETSARKKKKTDEDSRSDPVSTPIELEAVYRLSTYRNASFAKPTNVNRKTDGSLNLSAGESPFSNLIYIRQKLRNHFVHHN